MYKHETKTSVTRRASVTGQKFLEANEERANLLTAGD